MIGSYRKAYVNIVWRFIYYFNRPTLPEFSAIIDAFKNDPISIEMYEFSYHLDLSRLHKLLKEKQKEYLSEGKIGEILLQYQPLLKAFYQGKIQ